MEQQKTNFTELAKGIINPDTVINSFGHLFEVCYENSEQYQQIIGKITGHMIQITPDFNFDKVIVRVGQIKQDPLDITYSDNVCCKGIEEALRALIEPKLPELGERTKSHIATLAKEVPHLSDIFMELHNKIAA